MNKNVRLEYIDQLKGLAILLVVIGHVSLFCGNSKGIIYDFIYLFHMPLFFFLSGLVTKQIDSHRLKYLISRARVILIPFVIWGGLLVLSQNDSLFSFFADFMKGGYWYLWVLFEFYLFHVLFSLFSTNLNKKNKMWIDLSFLLLVYIVLKIGYHFIPSQLNDITGYLHWICYLPYFMAGVIIKKYNLSEKLFTSVWLYASAFALLLIFGAFSLTFNNISFIIVGTIIIILFNFFYRMPTNRITKGLARIGRHTLGIYLMHYFLLPYIHIKYITKTLIDTSNYIALTLLFVIIALVISMLCIVVELLLKHNKYLAILLLGKNK